MSKAVFAMMAAGTAISAYGAYQQGKIQQDLNNYNAQMAENNKILADQKYALDLKEHQKRYRHLLGKQRVSYAKSGVAVEGSAIDIIEEGALASAWEIQKMKYNKDVTKAGYTASAQRSRFVGESAYYTAKWNTAGTLLTGGSAAYNYGQEQNWSTGGKSWYG
jgi:hypothetical protein